jgi:type IV secretion system protein TrbL
MDNVGVIDRFLNTFTTYIDSGFGLIHGEVGYLTSVLIVLDITLAGLFWAWGADEDVMQRLVKKTLYIGFFAFVIGNFNHLAHIVFDSFAGLGLKAGGSTISINQFLQPGHLAQTGLDAGKPLLTAAGKLMGFRSFFANFVQIAVLMVSWVLVLIAFFILAVQLFVTILEFKLTTLAGFVLIPFALFNKTAFLAEKVLGNVVASGVKILVLAVIVGIGTGLFRTFTAGWGDHVPTDEQALSVVLAALSLLGLGIFGPGIANGLISGAPQLGAGAAVGTGLAVAGIGCGRVYGRAGRHRRNRRHGERRRRDRPRRSASWRAARGALMASPRPHPARAVVPASPPVSAASPRPGPVQPCRRCAAPPRAARQPCRPAINRAVAPPSPSPAAHPAPQPNPQSPPLRKAVGSACLGAAPQAQSDLRPRRHHRRPCRARRRSRRRIQHRQA